MMQSFPLLNNINAGVAKARSQWEGLSSCPYPVLLLRNTLDVLYLVKRKVVYRHNEMCDICNLAFVTIPMTLFLFFL